MTEEEVWHVGRIWARPKSVSGTEMVTVVSINRWTRSIDTKILSTIILNGALEERNLPVFC